jgi:hypothetical protein
MRGRRNGMGERGMEGMGTVVDIWARGVVILVDDNFTTMERTGRDGTRNPGDIREDLDGETSGDEEGDKQVRLVVGDRLEIRLLVP